MDVLRRSLRRRASLLVLGVWAVLSAAPGAQAQSAVDREYRIKAAFLYNFAKFVDWPPDVLPEASDTISICVLSEDPVYEALETIKGKAVKGRRLTIRRVDELKDLESCQVAFFGYTEEKRMPQALRTLQSSSVLTVGEVDRFAQTGGMINLVIENNKVRFEINVDRAERARLKLGSQLLSLAKVVKE